MNTDQPQTTAKSRKRRGVVLIAVLVVVVLLALAGYQYSDMTLAEYRASENAHRAVQARAFADSGIHYAAALLGNPDNFTGVLAGNPWNNPQAFQGIAIQGDNITGYFSIIAPPDPSNVGSTDCTYGVMDECGKINLNALMKVALANNDTTGQTVHDRLMLLPNMTDDIAYSIVAWLGGSAGTQNGGAGDDYYSGQTPPYRCKNGPLDSIDELLLVRGVTRDLLYGADWNRNGMQDPNEVTNNTFDRGWSAFLTVHSREQNADATGNAYVYLMNPDLAQLSTALSAAGINDDLVNFIVLCRQNNHSAFDPSTASKNQGDLTSYQADKTKAGNITITSLSSLLNAATTVSVPDATGKNVSTQFKSPLLDMDVARDQFPKLFAIATMTDPTKSTEIPARINVNTAPPEVLATLTGLTDTDVQNIVSMRPSMTSSDTASEVYQSPLWLWTEAQISPSMLDSLEQYITTRTQVFRVQSVGYYDGKGPAIRVEAIVDTNAGRPRILAWRNLSDLGKGWNNSNTNGNP